MVCAEQEEPPSDSVSIQPVTSDDDDLVGSSDDESGRGRRRSPWVWVGVAGGIAAAVAAVVLAVVLTRTPDQYDVGPIQVEDISAAE